MYATPRRCGCLLGELQSLPTAGSKGELFLGRRYSLRTDLKRLGLARKAHWGKLSGSIGQLMIKQLLAN